MKRILNKCICFCSACMIAVIVAAGSTNTMADVADENINQVPIYFIDTDTGETIYFEVMSDEEAVDNNFFYAPKYVFQDMKGTNYVLDMNHEDNCFRTRILGTIADTVVFSPIYVYYKEGVPDQRKTAVKICIRTNSDWMRKSNLIGIKYIDGLCVGESFSYQSEPEFAGVYGFVYDIFVYDKMNTDNQLAVSSLAPICPSLNLTDICVPGPDLPLRITRVSTRKNLPGAPKRDSISGHCSPSAPLPL